MVMAAAMLLTGCILTRESFTPVRYFDLGNPDPSKFSGLKMESGQFSVAGPYRQEMVFRTKDNELVKDSFNRWALTPDDMLSRYLRIALSDVKGKPYSISGNILSFEADMTRKEAVLTVEYKIVAPADGQNVVSEEKTCTFRSKMDGSSAEAFAAAMSAAVADFTASISGGVAGKPVKNK